MTKLTKTDQLTETDKNFFSFSVSFGQLVSLVVLDRFKQTPKFLKTYKSCVNSSTFRIKKVFAGL